MASRRFALLTVLLCTSATAPFSAAASLTPLGDLPGGSYFSVANGVSADGSVVVGQSISASGDEAFRWTSGGGMVGLGFLPGSVLGDSFSQALGVSADGSVIVGESTMATDREAFRWTSGDGMVSLGDLPEGTVGSQARGASANGSVIVGYGIPISNDPEAVRWTSASGIVALTERGFNSGIGRANSVSADGSVIVGHGLLATSAPRGEAFRWTEQHGMVGLGYLRDGIESTAYGVSSDGFVIVGSSSSASGDEAFRWTLEGGMVGLGALPGGDFHTEAYGVNGDGSIVVGLNRNPLDGSFRAFYWTAGGGMQALWDVLLAQGVDPAADGWTDLYEARGISADGNTIVGIGARNGNAEAFVAVIPVVPEPAAGALALVGAGGIPLLRRRSVRRPNKLHWAPGGSCAGRRISGPYVGAFLVVLMCMSAAAPAASLTPLGDLPGGGFRSVANGVSADGSTVVGFSGLGAGQEAFRWTSGGGMVGLGDFSGGTFESSANAVSADGSVVVGYGTRGNSISSREAFRWTSDGGMVGLGVLPGGSTYSEANGVSADGSTVVGFSELGGVGEAFRWTSDGGMVGLGFREAYSVSSDGSVVVGGGYRWTSDGGTGVLGMLAEPGAAAFGVSTDGSVVVGWGRSNLSLEAFRWTSDSGMVGLGDLPGGRFESWAFDVSGGGSSIVGYGSSDFGMEAFLWTSVGGMQRLWDVLLAEGLNPSADGWEDLEVASGISADGKTIVGWGTRNGNTEAFVAVIPTIVPEPAAGTLALLTLAVPALARRRLPRLPVETIMNLHARFRFVRAFSKGASIIIESPRSILSLVCTVDAVIAAALAAIALAPSPGLAATPAIYNLGTLLGGTYSQGAGVNDAGQVAGSSNFQGGSSTHPFRYDGTPGSDGIMRDLYTFGPDSVAVAVNNAGQVVGWWNNFFVPGRHAFRYDGTPGSDGVMHDLGTLGGADASAEAINDSGQVTGGSAFIPGDTLGSHAFRYDGTPGSDGVMHDLGTLGGTGSRGYGINNAGQVTGNSGLGATTAEPTHAFRYDGTPGSGGVMRDLGTLGGKNSYGVDINDAGEVAGFSEVTGSAVRHAFLYSGTPGAGGVMYDLGTLGGMQSQGIANNNAGQVVGWSEITGSTIKHPFLYTGTPGVDGQMIDLDVWLDANNPTEGAKWTLYDDFFVRISISKNTGWITGVGVYDPDGPGGIAAAGRAYLLDASSLVVPEPSALALLSLGGLTLSRRRPRTLLRASMRSCGVERLQIRTSGGHEVSRIRLIGSTTIAIIVSAVLAGAASTAVAASLTPLGINSIGNGVNGDGSVVVGIISASDSEFGQAFRWTAADGMVGLGRPPGAYL